LVTIILSLGEERARNPNRPHARDARCKLYF
jgi:hypothetical protein